MNIACTPRYISCRAAHDALFVPACRSARPERVTELVDGLRVFTCYYEGQVEYAVHASESRLVDGQEQVLYRWRNLNDDGEIAALVRHVNRRGYLVF